MGEIDGESDTDVTEFSRCGSGVHYEDLFEIIRTSRFRSIH